MRVSGKCPSKHRIDRHGQPRSPSSLDNLYPSCEEYSSLNIAGGDGTKAFDGNHHRHSSPRPHISDALPSSTATSSPLGNAAVAQLAAAYAAHAADILLPLPQLDADPARRALDGAVVSALGLDEEIVAAIRRSLAMEPSVTGRRYAGRPAV